MQKSVIVKNILFIAALAAFIAAAVILYRVLVKTDTDQTMSDSSVISSAARVQELAVSTAPDFSVQDAEGNSVRFADLVGKATVINFWASWCGPCQSEMYDFEAVYQEFGDEVQFMMINLTDGSRETKENAADYIEKHNLTFPVYYDPDGSAAKAYTVTSVPKTYFIDAEGNLWAEIFGATNSSTLEDTIQKYLLKTAED